MSMILMNFGLLNCQAYYLPQKLKIDQFEETFNETTILLVSYHLLCFTAASPEGARMFFGYSLIVLSVLFLWVNALVVSKKVYHHRYFAYTRTKMKQAYKWRLTRAKVNESNR